MTRDAVLQDFLSRNGWGSALHMPLMADASLRTYDRLFLGNKTAMLMNSPLSEHPEQFVLIDEMLIRLGVKPPRILAQDLQNGFILLEDFGDNTFTRLLNAGFDEYTLYQKGVDALITLQNNLTVVPTGVPAYTFQSMMFEVSLLPNWFGRYVVPGGLSDQAVADFTAVWTPLIQQIEALPKSLCLLDCHADNLMLTPDGACGLLDFQDARFGPCVYDLMSLLEDERRDVSADVRNRLIDRYFAARPSLDAPRIRDMLPVVAMQRHTKVIGIFVRLAMRDKKERYLHLIPFVWQLTECHLNNPLFTDYKKWLDTYIPIAARQTVFQLGEKA